MNIQLSDKIYKLFKKLFKFYWKGFLYLRLCFGFFEPVLGIFSLLSFGNSPLYSAKTLFFFQIQHSIEGGLKILVLQY